MLTYKQPRDWFAPVRSILAQVRMVVPVAVNLLLLHCMIDSSYSLTYIKLWACVATIMSNIQAHFAAYLHPMILFPLSFPSSPPPFHFPLPSLDPTVVPSLSISHNGPDLLQAQSVKINNIISTLSQFSINGLEVCLSRRIHHISSAFKISRLHPTLAKKLFCNHTANTHMCKNTTPQLRNVKCARKDQSISNKVAFVSLNSSQNRRMFSLKTEQWAERSSKKRQTKLATNWSNFVVWSTDKIHILS